VNLENIQPESPSSATTSTTMSKREEGAKNLQKELFAKLDWDLISHSLAQLALLPETKLLFQGDNLKILEPEERSVYFSLVEQLRNLEAFQVKIPLNYFNVSEILPRIYRQAPCSALEFLEVKNFLSNVDLLLQAKKSIQNNSTLSVKCEKLLELFNALPNIQKVSNVFYVSLENDGTISSNASPELKSSRSRVENAKKQIAQALERLMKKPLIQDALQDSQWMFRDGRAVLSVRTDRKGDVSGIVRSVSASGSTVFIEPQEIVLEQTNLERAEADVLIEENKVLQNLLSLAHGVREEIKVCYEVLLTIDNLLTRFKFSNLIQGTVPIFHSQREAGAPFFLRNAVHPLFVLNSKTSVRNNIFMKSFQSEEENSFAPNVMVLSGPNAGGKTVTMKTVGLLLLMGLCGLHVSAEEASFFEFDNILVEIGDRQNLGDDLSTFSGHLKHIKQILERANEKSLILMDEGFVGTDPVLGVALARSTLEYLAEKNSTVIITTHFSNLKTLSNINSKFCNGSMEFEPHEIRPTYKFLPGIPGQSYALELASRLGFPNDLLLKAKEYQGEEILRVEKLLEELQFERKNLEEQKNELLSLEQELQKEVHLALSQRKEFQMQKENLVAQYSLRLQKRLNAFENRLEIRERQFEKFKASQNNFKAATFHLNSEPPSTKNSDVKNSQGLVPKSQSSSASQPGSSGNLKIKNLEDLAQLKIKDKPVGLSKSGKLIQSTFEPRPAKTLDLRGLMEEAQESLEGLKKQYEKIDSEFLIESEILEEIYSSPKKTNSNKLHGKTSTQNTPQKPFYFWKVGIKIKHEGFKEVGEIIKDAGKDGMVTCRFGLISKKIHFSELKTIEQMAGQRSSNPPQNTKNFQKKQNASTPKKNQIISSKNKQNPMLVPAFSHKGNSVDVRGDLVDSAIEKVDDFLIKCWSEEKQRVYIIHGHGTGRVKQAVREHLANCEIKLEYRPGTSGEGGDGATAVEILE
jgi:DNA mismatch repair protein MutS2